MPCQKALKNKKTPFRFAGPQIVWFPANRKDVIAFFTGPPVQTAIGLMLYYITYFLCCQAFRKK